MGNICNVEPLQAQGTVVVDSAMSTSSENPLQNKVITNTINALGLTVVDGKLCQTYNKGE